MHDTTHEPDGTRPLSVVELESGPAAAYTARLLADLGARVIKLSAAGPIDDAAIAIDAGKTVLPLGSTAIEPLLASADIVLYEGMGDHLPVAPADLRLRFPRLITAAVTPFGESGPCAGYAGTDLIAFHAGGLGYGTPPRVTDPEAEHPLGMPGDAVALLCGLALAGGVLHSLAERDRDGRGRHVELSAQEVIASCIFNNIAGAVGDGPTPSRLAAARPVSRKPLLTCADGYVTVMANRPAHVRAWLETIGPEAKPLLDRLDRGASMVEVRAAVDVVAEQWTAGRSKHDVAALGQGRHVPVAPVLGPDELLASPQLAARGFWRGVPDASGRVRRIPEHPFGPLAPGEPDRRLPAEAPPQKKGGDLPLAGVRVVDFGWIFAGPIATRVLAALGAEVVRVESVHRLDQMRERPFAFRTVNADKRSAVIDAKSDEGKATLLALIRESDVVAENFAPGAMERLGLGWQTLHVLNPRLIMVSISGMGQTGPLRHWAMLGQLAQAYAAVTAMIGYEGGPPRGIEDGGFWTDPVAGYAATAAVLAALRERAVTGQGRRIDISLVEATAALFVRPLLAAQDGDTWGTRGNLHPAMAPHDVYRCAGEDRWVALAVTSDAGWRSLCALIDRPDLAADPALATLAGRQARRHELRAPIETWTRGRSPVEAAAAFQAAGIAAAPSYNAPELLLDPHLRERRFFELNPDAPGGVTMRAFPSWRLHPATPVRWGHAPELGEGTAAVLASVGQGGR